MVKLNNRRKKKKVGCKLLLQWKELPCYWRTEGEKREKGSEKGLAKNFPKLANDIKPQIQEARGEKKKLNNYRQVIFFKTSWSFWKPNELLQTKWKEKKFFLK